MGVFTGGGGVFFAKFTNSRARARACAETSDPQKFSKSAEKLSSGVFWGIESKNQLRIRK